MQEANANCDRYNSMSHAVPFMKASTVTAPAKAPKVVPDLEEAIEEEEGDVMESKEEDDDEDDIKADKYIKQPKAKGKKAAKKGDDEDNEQPKARGKKGATRGKGKK